MMETSPTPSSPERGSLGAGDLASKYTRLASEYSKVRAQLGVLKKAVIEEKNSKEKMTETLKENDTKMRKLEAEMDALNFRNGQLMHRVEFLQQESETQKSRRKTSNDLSNEVTSVLSEELHSKIQENVKLHGKLDEIDKRYDVKISDLTSEIESLKHQLRQSSQKDRAEDSKQKELIQGLKFDNAELVAKVTDMEKELVDAKDKITVLKVQLESSSAAIHNSSDSRRGSSKVSKLSLSSSGMPLNITEARIQTVEVLSTLGESVQNFVAASSDIHTYWEHRIKDLKLGSKLTDQSSQLSILLLQNVKFLRPIEQSFQDILSNVLSDPKGKFGFQLVHDFSGFSQSFTSYSNYAVHDIEPLMISCLQQESNASSCPPTQQAKNGQLVSALRNYGKTLTSLAKQIEALVASRDNNEALEGVENITVIISQLNQQASEMSAIFHAKATNEAQLPTTSEALRDTNSCIVSALTALSQGTSMLSHHLSDNLPKIGLLLTSEFTPEETTLEQETKSEQLNEEPLEEPTEKAEDKLKRIELMLEGLSEKLKKSEQSREHWKLECQLLQLKLGKVQEHSDEDFVSEAVKAKLDELVAARLLADSKATHFYLECLSLQKRNAFWEKAKKRAHDELKEAHSHIEDVKDEAKTTSVNYEDQLSLMSEHLANMNDKLTQQTDEIDRLKYELKNSGGKK